jgi:AcrR family transcriptional regulator
LPWSIDAAILTAARQLLLEVGYANVSMEAIAAVRERTLPH